MTPALKQFFRDFVSVIQDGARETLTALRVALGVSRLGLSSVWVD
jgi:hypothetical protein